MNRYTFTFKTTNSFRGECDNTKEYGRVRLIVTQPEVSVIADHFQQAIDEKVLPLVKDLMAVYHQTEVVSSSELDLVKVEEIR